MSKLNRIIGVFYKTVKKLDKLAEKNNVKIDKQVGAVMKSQEKIATLNAENHRAKKISDKIKELVQ